MTALATMLDASTRDGVASVRKVLSTTGTPLRQPLRQDLEERFAADFSRVQIHADPLAQASADAMGARAYARGEHIVLGRRVQQDSPERQQVLGHELAHVVQQRRGGPPPTMRPGAPHEIHADAVARQIGRGQGRVHVSGVTGVGLACLDEDNSWTARLRRKAAALADSVPPEYRQTVHAAAEELKGYARDKVQEGLGAVKGVVTQVTEVADTALWVGGEYQKVRDTVAAKVAGPAGTPRNTAVRHALDAGMMLVPGAQAVPLLARANQQAKEHGLVDSQTGEASLTSPLSDSFNDLARSAEHKLDAKQRDPEMFSPMEMAELKANIGTQVLLSFTGAEEVKIAMNVVGALGSVRGIVTSIERDPGWATSSQFWSGVIGLVLSIVGLKHSMAAGKITTLLLKYGWVAAAVPPLAQLAADYIELERHPDMDPEQRKQREERIRQGWKSAVNVLKDAILHVAQSSGGQNAAKPAGAPGEGSVQTVAKPGAVSTPATAPLVDAPAAVPAATSAGSRPPVHEASPDGNLLPLKRPQAPGRSSASRKLDANLDRLPEQLRGSVTPLRPNRQATGQTPPLNEPQWARKAVGQTHGPENVGSEAPKLRVLEGGQHADAPGQARASLSRDPPNASAGRPSSGPSTTTSSSAGSASGRPRPMAVAGGGRRPPSRLDAMSEAASVTGSSGRSLSAPEELGGAPRRPDVDDPDTAGPQRLRAQATLGTSAHAARMRGLPSAIVESGYVYTREDLPQVAPDTGPPAARPARPAPPLAQESTRGVAGRAPTSAPDWGDVQNSELASDQLLIHDHLAKLNEGRPEGARWTLEDVRVNRTQTAAGEAGPTRASRRTRPDFQFTLRDPEGVVQRILIEYDRAPPARALAHARGILERDPTAIVILKIIGFD